MLASDRPLLDLLRNENGCTIHELEEGLQVTATAVRQRLNRLMGAGWIERKTDRANGRGRPSHRYCLTEIGRRQAGANFADLSFALWQEIRSIKHPEIRRGLLKRLAARMAEQYRKHVDADDVRERMEQVASMFSEREVPFAVEDPAESELPVLTAHACPYPDLAEQDRSVCAMERMLFSELLGKSVTLADCRLDGDNCCTFQLSDPVVQDPA